MINLRKNLFETNSSSVHAIVIQNDNNIIVQPWLYFGCGDYGWRHEHLYTASERAAYLYSAILTLYDKTGVKDWIDYLTSVLSKNDCIADFEEPTYYNGYVDNASVDHVSELYPLLRELKEDSDMLLRFLFGTKSEVITANDNDDDSVSKLDLDVKNVEDCELFFKGN